MTAGDGSHWNYDYDGVGQLITANRFWADGSPVGGQQFSYQYDEAGNRLASGGRASSQAAYSRNLQNQMVGYDPARVVDVVGLADPAETVTVNNQAADRQGAYYHEALAFGGTGIAYETVTVDSNGETEQGAHYLPATPAPAQSYDLDGNLSQDARWIYTWDAENRLVEMKTITGVPLAAERRLEFGYDYQGRRISKKVFDRSTGGTVLRSLIFVYHGTQIIAEINETTGSLLRSYTWGLDLSESEGGVGGVGGLLQITDHEGGTPVHYYVESDGQGNVRSLVEASSGQISAFYEYGPFGEQIRATGPAAALNPFRYSSQYRDEETGLVSYLYRYYSPERGNWLNRDPIGELGGLNLAGFVNNDPINNIDAFGLAVGDWWDPRTQICRSKGLIVNLGGQLAGFADVILNPIDTIDAVFDAIWNAGETFESLLGAGSEGLKKYRRSKQGCISPTIACEMEGALMGELLTTFAGAGLIGKLGKAAKLDELAKLKLLETIRDFAKSKAAKVADEFGDAADDASKGRPQTGGGEFTGAADDLYDAIRASTTDVDDIARNTGFKPSNVQKVKDHLFHQEHLLDRYVDIGEPAVWSRFDSDLGQAQAWFRLQRGGHTADDLRFLKHEAAEAWYMRRHGPGYSEAHDAASRRFPMPRLPAE